MATLLIILKVDKVGEIAEVLNKKLSYRKETVRLLHNIEIMILHQSHIPVVLIGLCRSNRERRLTFRRVIIEKWMYFAQRPSNNALLLFSVGLTSANIAINDR